MIKKKTKEHNKRSAFQLLMNNKILAYKTCIDCIEADRDDEAIYCHEENFQDRAKNKRIPELIFLFNVMTNSKFGKSYLHRILCHEIHI